MAHSKSRSRTPKRKSTPANNPLHPDKPPTKAELAQARLELFHDEAPPSGAVFSDVRPEHTRAHQIRRSIEGRILWAAGFSP